MTRSKQESTATIKLVNLVMKRDSVFMAFSSGRGPVQTPFWCGNAFLVNPLWLRLCRVGNGPEITSRDRSRPGVAGAESSTPRLGATGASRTQPQPPSHDL